MDMSLEIFRIIAFCCGALSFVCLIVAVFVFVKLKIPYVISDLKGNIKNISIKEREKENLKKNKNDINSTTMNAKNEQGSSEQYATNIANDEENDDEYTKPLISEDKVFDNFKIIKSVVFVNTGEEIRF